jgi:hypothetical protein
MISSNFYVILTFLTVFIFGTVSLILINNQNREIQALKKRFNLLERSNFNPYLKNEEFHFGPVPNAILDAIKKELEDIRKDIEWIEKALKEKKSAKETKGSKGTK